MPTLAVQGGGDLPAQQPPPRTPAFETAGAKANRSGQALEEQIEVLFRAKGFATIRYKDWDQSLIYQTRRPRVVVLDAPYDSIYGHKSKIEFLLITENREVLIEVKRMSVSGSYDEKLPYVFANALLNLADRDYILIMDGDGWRPGAVRWIENQAELTNGFEVVQAKDVSSWLDSRF